MAELKKSVLLRLDPEFLRRVDVAAGEVPRHRWIVGRLEEALGVDPARGSAVVPDGAASPASPRASSEPTVVEAANRSKEEQVRVKREFLAGLEGDGSGGPPPSDREANDKPIVPQLPAYRCRVAACDWAGADSPAARCSKHPGPTVKR